MKNQELQQILATHPDTEVVIRGKFGDTLVRLSGVKRLSDGKLLLMEEKGPLLAPVPEYIDSFIDFGDVFLEIKEFLGTEPEVYKGVGVGFEKTEKGEKIYVESEKQSGMFSMLSVQADEAKWLARKLLEYAEEIENGI